MNQRALIVLRRVGPFVIACALTWAASWLMQYICWLTIKGQSFNITSKYVNRVALATIIAVIILAVVIMFVLATDGCLAWLIGISIWLTILGVISWVPTLFHGGPVATSTAQFCYGVAVLLWSALMWYIFLEGATTELSEA